MCLHIAERTGRLLDYRISILRLISLLGQARRKEQTTIHSRKLELDQLLQSQMKRTTQVPKNERVQAVWLVNYTPSFLAQ